MTAESNYAIAIATLSDWLKNLAPFFFFLSQLEAKPIAGCSRDFSRALSKLQVITRNCDWFIALFFSCRDWPELILFGIGFSTVN